MEIYFFAQWYDDCRKGVVLYSAKVFSDGVNPRINNDRELTVEDQRHLKKVLKKFLETKAGKSNGRLTRIMWISFIPDWIYFNLSFKCRNKKARRKAIEVMAKDGREPIFTLKNQNTKKIRQELDEHLLDCAI